MNPVVFLKMSVFCILLRLFVNANNILFEKHILINIFPSFTEASSILIEPSIIFYSKSNNINNSNML